MVGIIGVIVVAVIAVIYNSPLSIFFPQPDTGYDSPRTVLCEYYKEFNDQIMKLEKDDYVITYQNTEDGAPVSNFNDTLMVYMVKYGTGQAGFVMDEEGKKNLKKVFDEMNYYDSSSSTAQIPAGASLGEVVTTGYCSCSMPSVIDFARLKREYSKPYQIEGREFDIEIREILSRVENIKADTLGDAIDKAMEMYERSEVVLNADDYKGVDYIPVKHTQR